MLNLSGDRDLVEFSFESKAVGNLPNAVMLRLARRSSAYNTRMGLTGQLVLSEGRFTQSLEGPADTLLSLAARILADPRHEAIRTIAFRAIESRRFSQWRIEGFDIDGTGDSFGAAVRFMPPAPVRRGAANLASVHSIGTGTV
jgi:hypothetical protein